MTRLLLAVGAAIITGIVAAQTAVFDVASVKPNLDVDSRLRMQFLPGGKFTATAATLPALVRHAYGVRDIQVTGARGWMTSDRFDITAASEAASGKLPEEQLRRMLQALLAERFQLKLHKESKEMPIYALVVGKSGAKLKPLNGSHAPFARTGRGLAVLYTSTMWGLAGFLTNSAGRMVVDETGLTGEYDIGLEFMPERLNGAPPPDGDSGPTIFAAVQEQLGLKLEARKGPVEIIVIESAERPSGN